MMAILAEAESKQKKEESMVIRNREEELSEVSLPVFCLAVLELSFKFFYRNSFRS